ncbi:MAG: glycosyltransferase family 2 protein [Caulobacteraceae bacterium]
MRVGVCIVGFRNPEDICTCVATLGTSTHRDFEVIVHENGGDEAFRTLASILPPALPEGQSLRVIGGGENLGYAGGMNQCMASAPDVDAWWILNPDTRPEPQALSRLCTRLAIGDCGAVGATLIYPDRSIESRGCRWRPWLARGVALDHGLSPDSPCAARAAGPSANYLGGASILVARTAVERAGPMREDYFLYVEDVEWCLRMAQAGVRLAVESSARVVHTQGSTTGSDRDVRQRPRLPVYLDERNKMLLTRDRFPAYLPVAAPAALILLFSRFARRGAWRQLVFGMEGWWAGLRNQRGRPDWISQTG